MAEKWSVFFHQDFCKDLKKLDKPVASRVIDAVERLGTFDTPPAHCKALTGQLAGLWRYRVGDYRVIIDFDKNHLVIVALGVDHRSKVYR
jgi:addiction module toxin, relE/stbE family